jgi:Na+-translocating ferredoxin:NAD+ oxidoreductase RnfE subunit
VSDIVDLHQCHWTYLAAASTLDVIQTTHLEDQEFALFVPTIIVPCVVTGIAEASSGGKGNRS